MGHCRPSGIGARDADCGAVGAGSTDQVTKRPQEAAPSDGQGPSTSLSLPPTSREDLQLDFYLEYPHASKALYIYKHPRLLQCSNPSPAARLNTTSSVRENSGEWFTNATFSRISVYEAFRAVESLGTYTRAFGDGPRHFEPWLTDEDLTRASTSLSKLLLHTNWRTFELSINLTRIAALQGGFLVELGSNPWHASHDPIP
ncbi:hypothetical protein TNCV_4803821 [Trichonephila clavipes]|nr:hypothetical protein TNCV_4803821 [Trichonephila clavipes]